MSNPRKVTDPRVVLERIESPQSSDAHFETVPAPHQLRVLHPDSDSPLFDDRLDEHIEVPLQVLELADHLKHSRQKLVERERELDRNVESWREDIDSQRAANSATAGELRNRELQLRSLQFHLLQMQNDLVDSQVAMESVIRHFENVDSDGFLKQALELLRFEVLDRFDYLSKRWEMLHARLEALRDDEPQRKCA